MDNIHWSFVDFATGMDIVPTRVVERFMRAKEMTLDDARTYAFKLEEEVKDSEELNIIEYGISTIFINKTWKELVQEAKVMAFIEKVSIEASGRLEFWKYDINRLDAVLKY